MYTANNKILTVNSKIAYVPTVNPVWNGLISYWRMEDNATDAMGYANGTFTNATYGTGKHNKCASLATNRKIDFGNNFSWERTQAYSIGFWIKINTAGTNAILTNLVNGSPYRGNIDLNLDASGNLTWFIVSTWGSNHIRMSYNTFITDTNWHHVVCTYAGNSSSAGMKVYRDGNNIIVTTINADNLSATTINTEPLVLGNRQTSQWLAAEMDEVCFWNRELAPTEITALYNSGTGLFY